MTDKTQPDSGRATGGIVEMLHARIAELEARVQELGAMARENRSRRIVELEAKLASVSAGGVQALSAAPEAIAKLRHLYQNMVNGAVRDTASAKRIAEGLLAPAIEALERATPPAKQQAAPKAAPNLPERDASLPAERQGLFRKFVVGRVDGSDKPGGKHHGCTYFVLDVDHDPCARPALAAYAAACESTHPTLAADLRTKWGVVPAPQPAPAPLSDDVVKDAARYRWLREGNDAKHGAAWHVAVNLYGCEWDAAIDAALAAQGGE